jgi:hypothetical protein
MGDAFALKDCALIAISTGKRAQNLRELRDRMQEIPEGCIYYHFWGGLLHPRFDDPEYQNDFAAWAYHGLNDIRLAERLGIISPTDFPNLEDLRREVIEVIEERLDESELVPWSKVDRQFYFVHSKTVVFDTTIRVDDPVELCRLVPHLSTSTIFYHFIDARRRTPDRVNDFSRWLLECGEEYAALARRIADVDPYFLPLTEVRAQLSTVFQRHLPERGSA